MDGRQDYTMRFDLAGCELYSAGDLAQDGDACLKRKRGSSIGRTCRPAQLRYPCGRASMTRKLCPSSPICWSARLLFIWKAITCLNSTDCLWICSFSCG